MLMRSSASFFPDGTISADELPKKGDDWQAKSAAEKKIAKKVTDALDEYFKALPQTFPRLEAVDLRGLESYGEDSELNRILRALVPMAHRLLDLRLVRNLPHKWLHFSLVSLSSFSLCLFLRLSFLHCVP
jgi:hypothetical protein